MTKNNYKLWDINPDNYPKNGTIEEQISFILKYGELAPSTHNTQPWIVSFESSNDVIIQKDKTKSLKVADPSDMWVYFSIGMFTSNVVEAGLYFGKKVNYKVDGDSVKLNFTDCKPNPSDSLLVSITKRASNKQPYDGQSVEDEANKLLDNWKMPKNLELRYIPRSSLYEEIVTLHMNSAKKVANNHDFVKELSRWMRPNWTRSTNGMPGFIIGIASLPSYIFPKILKIKPEIFKKKVNNERTLLESSSAILIVGSESIRPVNMVDAGLYSERLWLAIIKLEMVGHPMTASMHDVESYNKIKSRLDMNYQPIYLMRIGYPSNDQVLHSPRKVIF